MKHKKRTRAHFPVLYDLIRWTFLVLPMSVVTGSMVALFLWLLHEVIEARFHHSWLLYFLPLAGVSIHFLYRKLGKTSEGGNNLIIEEIHQPGAGVPRRMGVLVLFSTLVTHLFGGSAGREGTAVQIGGSTAGLFNKWLGLNAADAQTLLTAGVAAGFGAVFGTPLAGAIFAMEVLALGRIQYNALLPCLMAGILGDLTVTAWGVHHTQYHIDMVSGSSDLIVPYFHIDPILLLKVLLASVLFGLAAFFFSELAHGIKTLYGKIASGWAIPFAGGCTIILLTFIIGKPDYLSLGVDPEYPGAVTISSAFQEGGANTLSWFWKSLYTALTVGTGFKGGEVTPLFYIGSTLGNTLAGLFNAPVSLFAALGFIAVFSGATNTPIACTIMGVELFGGDYILFFAVACFTAYLFSGHSGIYSSQRITVPKAADAFLKEERSLADAIKRRRRLRRKW